MKLCPIAHWKKHRPNALAFPSLTFAGFDELIQKICHSLINIPEPILSFAPQKTPIDLALFFAAWRSGKAVYPLNPRLPPDAIQERIEKTKSAWIETGKIPLTRSYDIANIYPNCLATLIETSSASKIACHTLQNHMISAKSVCKALKLSQEDIYCLNLPLFHISGIAIMIRTFLSGAQITFPETLETATHISMVPTQLYRFLNNGCTLPNCKCLLMGGAPLGEKLYKEALAKNLPLYSSYGMTETASMAMLKPPYSKTQILPHIELSLKEDGEILLRGPSLFSHYWGKRPRKKDWFATRDIGKLHRDGEIEILGRKDRQFISGGENIQPEEIEKILMQLDSIIGAHITPESDLEFGMRPKATVYTERPLSADAIKAQLKKFLPTYKIPEKIKIIIGEEASKLVLEPESSSPTPFQ